MNRLVALLAEHGGLLALGLTIWLALGCIAMRLVRSPIHALRIAEATLLLALLWAGLACVPFDRYSIADVWGDVRDSLTAGDAGSTAEAPPTVMRQGDRHIDFAIEQRMLPVAKRPAEVSARRANSDPRSLPPVLRPAWRPRPAFTRQPVEPVRSVETVHRAAPGNGVPQAAVLAAATSSPSKKGAAPAKTVSISSWLTPRRLATAYVAGSGLAIAWLLIGRLALRRLERAARAAEPWLNGLYASVLPAGIGRRPRLLVSDRCGRPLAFGLWRPVILLPRSLCHRHHAGALRHVLRHELAHVGQCDAWGHLLFNIAFPLCYFHPLYWWLRARAGLCRELIADDQAAAGTDKRAYVSDLLDVARQWRRRCDARLGALGVFESSSQFYRRMTMLCERERPLEQRCGWWWRSGLLAIGCLAVALLGLTLGRPAAADDDAQTATLLALDDEDRDGDDQDGDDADEEGESEEAERDEDEGESEEDSDEESEDDADAEDEESDEESDDEDDGDDESEDEESDDEESEEEADEDEGEGDEQDDDAEEGDDEAEDEGDLDALMAEKEEIANRLAELESTIEEASARRAQRLAARESAAEQEARLAAEEEESGRWQGLLETLQRLSEQQERLQQTVGEMSERIEALTRDKEALSEEVNSLRERLGERGDADEDEDREASDDDEDASDEDDEAPDDEEESDREENESDDD